MRALAIHSRHDSAGRRLRSGGALSLERAPRHVVVDRLPAPPDPAAAAHSRPASSSRCRWPARWHCASRHRASSRSSTSPRAAADRRRTRSARACVAEPKKCPPAAMSLIASTARSSSLKSTGLQDLRPVAQQLRIHHDLLQRCRQPALEPAGRVVDQMAVAEDRRLQRERRSRRSTAHPTTGEAFTALVRTGHLQPPADLRAGDDGVHVLRACRRPASRCACRRSR